MARLGQVREKYRGGNEKDLWDDLGSFGLGGLRFEVKGGKKVSCCFFLEFYEKVIISNIIVCLE